MRPEFVVALREFSSEVSSKRSILLLAAMLAVFFLLVASVEYAKATFMRDYPILVEVFTPLVEVFVNLVGVSSFAVPLIAIAAGHDAFSREREEGTLVLVMARPLSRLQFLAGKILGFALYSSFVLLVSCLAALSALFALLGVRVPLGAVAFLVAFYAVTLLLSMIYYLQSFLFSVVSRGSGQSLALSVALFLALTVAPIVLAYAVKPGGRLEDFFAALDEFSRYVPNYCYFSALSLLLPPPPFLPPLPLEALLDAVVPQVAYMAALLATLTALCAAAVSLAERY